MTETELLGIAYGAAAAVSLLVITRGAPLSEKTMALAVLWPLFWAVVAVMAIHDWTSTRPYRIGTRIAYRLFGKERLAPSVSSMVELLADGHAWCGGCQREVRRGASYCTRCGRSVRP